MKTILIALATILTSGTFAQTEGEIIYTEKIDMHANLPEGEQGEMIKKMMPQYQETKSTLLFNKTQSLYQKKEQTKTEEKKSPLENEEEDVEIKIEMSSPDEKIYTDVEEGLVVEQRDLMGKTFLIKDTINPAKWKITGESKVVSGLNCLKATMETEDGEVVAWFTSQIPVSSGPAGFGGLPGLIVHIRMRDGDVEFTASNIIPRKLEKGEIKVPKKGKDVSREEFLELREKKMEQMKKQYGGQGDGNVIMITTEEEN